MQANGNVREDLMERGTAVVTAAAAAALLAAAPAPARALATLASPAASADPLLPLLSLIALVAWALLGWLLAVALAVAASRVPGAGRRVAGRVARFVAPAAVRRLLEVSLGLSVAVGVLGASPASAGTHPAPP